MKLSTKLERSKNIIIGRGKGAEISRGRAVIMTLIPKRDWNFLSSVEKSADQWHLG